MPRTSDRSFKPGESIAALVAWRQCTRRRQRRLPEGQLELPNVGRVSRFVTMLLPGDCTVTDARGVCACAWACAWTVVEPHIVSFVVSISGRHDAHRLLTGSMNNGPWAGMTGE